MENVHEMALIYCTFKKRNLKKIHIFGNTTALGVKRFLNNRIVLIKVTQFTKVCDQNIWMAPSLKSCLDLRFHGLMK